jgi:hypothetical protein
MQQDAGGEGVFRVETTNITTTGASTSTSLNAADTSTNAISSMSTSFLVSAKQNTWSRSARRKKKTKMGEEESRKRKVDEADDDRRKVGKYRRVEGGVESQGPGGGSAGGGLLRTDGDDVWQMNSAGGVVGGASVGESGPSSSIATPAGSDEGEFERQGKMVCSIQVVPPSQAHTEPGPGVTDEPNGSDSYSLRFQWVYGFDRQMVEGFVSHVGQKVSLVVVESS